MTPEYVVFVEYIVCVVTKETNDNYHFHNSLEQCVWIEYGSIYLVVKKPIDDVRRHWMAILRETFDTDAIYNFPGNYFLLFTKQHTDVGNHTHTHRK